jgi:hypothetical protein
MELRTVAIYRLLYGSDFIGESLESVYPWCSKILCFVGHEMFGGLRAINYFGHDVYLPHDIDGVTEAIQRWKRGNDPQDKVELIDNPYAALLKGQVSEMINNIVIPRYECSHVLFVEADEVWRRDAIARLFDVASSTDDDEYMAPACHLFWRSPAYRSIRNNPAAVLRALKGRRSIGPTWHALTSASEKLRRREDPAVRIHNFGYAASERTIFWKHMTALSFSRDRKLDSPPREEWFEEVWRAWSWSANRRTDLCPSIGFEDAFSPAEEYPFAELPEPMQRRVKTDPLPEWSAAA